jgi:hypothetical protein
VRRRSCRRLRPLADQIAEVRQALRDGLPGGRAQRAGSSAKITDGAPTTTRAIATRYRWPPESRPVADKEELLLFMMEEVFAGNAPPALSPGLRRLLDGARADAGGLISARRWRPRR